MSKRPFIVQAFSETRSAYYALSADFCAVRPPCDDLSPVAETQHRSPEVRSTAFAARPPNLPPRPLMAVDLAIRCSLVRPGRPLYPVFVHRAAALLHASFRPRLATTPLRFANPSPPSGWIEDFTSKLSNKLGAIGIGGDLVGRTPATPPSMRVPHRTVREVEVMRAEQSEPARPVQGQHGVEDHAAVTPPATAVGRHLSRNVKLGLAPSASSFMVVPRFHCLSWRARSRR